VKKRGRKKTRIKRKKEKLRRTTDEQGKYKERERQTKRN
jgi:hypothetical protein